jgi:hypothetical protein
MLRRVCAGCFAPAITGNSMAECVEPAEYLTSVWMMRLDAHAGRDSSIAASRLRPSRLRTWLAFVGVNCYGVR